MNIIKYTRKNKHLSLLKIAHDLRIPLGLYWYYENHPNVMTSDMIMQIFDILNIEYTS